jgi:type I restriction enzyme S subunit
MSMTLRPYPEYKESGLPWLEKIPKHWEVRRFKYLMREVNSRSSDGQDQLLSVSQYTGVTPRRALDGGDEPNTRAASLVGYKRVGQNDLVVNIMLAWNGSLGVARSAGIASPAYCVYRFNDHVEPWFYHNLLRLPAYKGRIKVESTGVVESRLRLYTDNLFRIEALFPPKEEQVAIAKFVEAFGRQVERLIREKQKMIALLNEQKQAIIHRAVTRGLDPNIRLKPSGVEWLGDVPEHWEVKPLKYWVHINRHTLPESTLPDYHFRYIDIGSVETGYLVKEPVVMQFKDAPSRARRLLSIGDTIISTVRTYLKAVYYVADEVNDLVASTGFAVLTPRTNVDPEYLSYVIQGNAFIDRVTAYSTGIAYPAISETRLGAFHLALPQSIQDQKAIASTIRKETSMAASAIQRAGTEINLLREYRTRLISDVVTGKLDVHGVELPAMDEGETVEDLNAGVDEIEDIEENTNGDED